MRERLASRGLPLPVFREDERRRLFLVTLPGVPLAPFTTRAADESGDLTLNPRQRRMLDDLALDESISAADYQDRYGVSRRTATADLASLARHGLMEVSGARAATRYRRITVGGGT
jgi:predicted HTH transcriptional regulator